jgi:hypothetical protein
MEENSPVKKRLVLTTAHDNQKSIQIDLYNSYAKTMADALYVGSLVVEHIKPQPKGDPNIELILSSNSAGQIAADVVDLDASADGAPQHLSVSLTDVEEDDRENDEIPDFDLEDQGNPSGLYDRDASPGRLVEKKKFPWLLAIIAAALLLAIGSVLCLLFLADRGTAIRRRLSRPVAATAPAAPEPSAPAPTLPPTPEPAPVAPVQTPRSAPPVISAAQQPSGPEADRTRTVPPSAPNRALPAIPQEGILYKIRWGDTLWDISEAFYRNPWMYTRIARFNTIRNPDFIISGKTIRIPPVN